MLSRTLLSLLAAASLAAVDAPVLNKTEVTLKSRSDEFVATKELWYSRHDGTNWGAWQKLGLTFGREAPVVWKVEEGHWRAYVRYSEVSGGGMPEPAQQADTKLFTEFVIDRSAPQIAVAVPASGAKLRGNTKALVKWQVTDGNLATNTVAIHYSRTGNATDFVAVAEGLAASGTFEWQVPGDMTQAGVIRISAKDLAGNAGEASNNNILVDSIAPGGRMTGPAISAAQQVDLQLKIADAGPAGLASAVVWLSQDNGQTWAEGPVVSAPFTTAAWTAPRDGRYRFAVVAIDQAGNPTPTPKGATDDQGQLLVDTARPVVLIQQANGVVEAEGMKPRQVYLPGTRVAVQFEIKDAALAANPVTVWLSTETGKWEEVAKGQPADAAVRFVLPAKDKATARIKITAVDTAGNVGEAIATETFIIKGAVDTGPVGLE